MSIKWHLYYQLFFKLLHYLVLVRVWVECYLGVISPFQKYKSMQFLSATDPVQILCHSLWWLGMSCGMGRSEVRSHLKSEGIRNRWPGDLWLEFEAETIRAFFQTRTHVHSMVKLSSSSVYLPHAELKNTMASGCGLLVFGRMVWSCSVFVCVFTDVSHMGLSFQRAANMRINISASSSPSDSLSISLSL